MTSDASRYTSDLVAPRDRMLALLTREISDQRVIEAFAAVPREEFVRPEDRSVAYDDRPLAIGFDQTISQPLIVAITLQALRLQGDEHVLDVGTGSGYQAALLSLLVRSVVSVERIADLRARASATLARLGYDNVVVVQADAALGWPPAAPYNRIAVAAGAPEIPDALVEQLVDHGRLVVPVGPRDLQTLVAVTREGDQRTIESLGPCRFVPLIGEGAWRRD